MKVKKLSKKRAKEHQKKVALRCNFFFEVVKRAGEEDEVDERVPDFPKSGHLKRTGVLQGQPKRNETENARRNMEGTYRDRLTQLGQAFAPGGPSSETPRSDDSTSM